MVVEYTVNAQGSVEGAFVVDSSSTLFEAAAVSSVEKFKYAPRVENGVPVAVPGVRSVIRFALE